MSNEREAFAAEMLGRRFGHEETQDARAWFSAGWQAALRAQQPAREAVAFTVGLGRVKWADNAPILSKGVPLYLHPTTATATPCRFMQCVRAGGCACGVTAPPADALIADTPARQERIRKFVEATEAAPEDAGQVRSVRAAMEIVRLAYPEAEVEHALSSFVITKYPSGCDWVLAEGDTIYNAWRNAASRIEALSRGKEVGRGR